MKTDEEKPSKNEKLTKYIVESRILPVKEKPKRQPRTTINICRKGSIVMERCRQLTETALELFPNRKISSEDLEYLITKYIGGDRGTIRAYMGYRGRVARSKSSGEGYVVGNPKKGYLETFGFMHRISNGEWVIHAQMKLSNAGLGNHNNEGVEKKSMKKISLSPKAPVKGAVNGGDNDN